MLVKSPLQISPLFRCSALAWNATDCEDLVPTLTFPSLLEAASVRTPADLVSMHRQEDEIA